MGLGPITKLYSYFIKGEKVLIDPKARDFSQEVEIKKMLEDLKNQTDEEFLVSSENKKMPNKDVVTFNPENMKKILKEMKSRGIKYGYTPETIENYFNKQYQSITYSPEQSQQLIREALKVLEGGENIDVEAVDGLLRFDITKVTNEAYVKQYKVQMEGVIKQIALDAVQDGSEIASKSRDDLLKLANEKGHVNTFLDLLNKPTGESFKTADEAINAVLLREIYEIELERLSLLVKSGKKDPVSGFSLDELKIQLYDTVQTAKLILPKIYAAQSESGRVLQAQGNISRNLKGSKTLTEQWQIAAGKGDYESALADIFTKHTEIDTILDLANAYVALPKGKRTTFVSNATNNWARDRYNSLYVYSLLGSPDTQMRNIYNNSFKQLFHFIKEPINIGVYKAGKLIENTKNKIRNNDADTVFIAADDVDGLQFIDYYIDMIAEHDALALALRNAGYVARNNEAIDRVQKIDNANRTTYRTDAQIDATDNSGVVKSANKIYNNIQTLAGRALMTADEFFATLSFNRVLMRRAYKQAHKIYSETGNLEEAQSVFIRTMTDFDADDIEGAGKALAVAGEDRFITHNVAATNKITRFMRRNPGLMDSIPVKLMIPMRRVFSEMLRQSAEMTPMLGTFATKRARDDWMAGGARRTNVIAKQAIATFTVIATARLACGLETEGQTFCMTGSEPHTDKAKEFWESRGLSKYGIFVKNEEDETWNKAVSYELSMPLAIPLALGANFAQVAQFTDTDYDDDWLDYTTNILSNSSSILAPYVETSPFVQPVYDLMDDMARVFAYPDKVDTITKWLAKNANQSIGNVTQQFLGGVPFSPGMLDFIESSFYNNVEDQTVAPELDDVDLLPFTGLDEETEDWFRQNHPGLDLDRAKEEFYTGFARRVNKFPGMNYGENAKINYRGEEQVKDFTVLQNTIKGFASESADPVKIYFADNGITSPNTLISHYNIKKDLGIDIESEEYYLYRDMLTSEKIVLKDYADDEIFNGEALTLGQALDKLIQDDDFRKLPAKNENFNGKEDFVQHIYQQYKDRASEVTLDNQPDLRARIGNK